jgi:steroid delta-isomerase-like uncharacterized protein
MATRAGIGTRTAATATRRATLAAALAALVGARPASGQDATPAPSCPPATDAELERIARAWYEEGYNSGDPGRLRDLLAADVADDGPNRAATEGPADLMASMQAVLDGFPDVRYTVDRVLTEAPYAVILWTAHGTQTGEFLGIPASGNHAAWSGIRVFRIECGRIAQTWGELDQIGRLQQIGAVPATPEPVAGDDLAPASPIPATPGATPSACPPSGRSLVAAAVRDWWDLGWNGGNPAGLGPIVSDGLLHHWATGPDTVGFVPLATTIDRWRQAMPDLVVTPGDLIVDGDWAAATWTASGADTGGLAGGAATGNRATWTGINVFRLSCGQITEVWSEMDVLSLRAQLAATVAP